MRARGFTLIELLSALLILSLLAVMSFRGLGAVLDAREQVGEETRKWKSVAAFFSRFQRDVQLSAPLPLRTAPGRLELNRFAAAEGIDTPRRVAYQLTGNHEIELVLWPGTDAPAEAQPARYAVLRDVTRFELQYLNLDEVWVEAWPTGEKDPPLPAAMRLHLVLASGEDLVRVFALK